MARDGNWVLENLAAAGRRIGAHKELTQGAGGNISHKAGHSIWIKSSGTWLETADAARTFSRVDQETLASAIDASFTDRSELDLSNLAMDGEPRPSMEIAVHSLLRKDIVLHVHSVAVIAFAIRADGQALLSARLQGLRWRWIPYAKPGHDLAALVEPLVEDQPDILVLANHGLFVQAATLSEAESLLAEVERRVAEPASELQPASEALERMALDTGMRVPASIAAHQSAFHPSAAAKITSAPYPDHVVYLGAGPLLWSTAEQLLETLANYRQQHQAPAPYMIVDGHGVLVDANSNSGVVPMLECLGLVLARTAADAELTLLSPEQERALTASPAELFRIALGTTHA